jgi:hypothetical protein
MGGIMGNTKAKDSKSEPPPQPNNAITDWEEVEYKECSEDWRHRDRLIWATLPVAATVGGVIVGVAYGQIPYCKPELRFWILLIGVILTSVMLISLLKHRLFQEGSREQMRSLYVPPNIKDCNGSPRKHLPPDDFILRITPSKRLDAKLTSWLRRRSGFKFMLVGTLVVKLILLGLAIHTLVQWIIN